MPGRGERGGGDRPSAKAIPLAYDSPHKAGHRPCKQSSLKEDNIIIISRRHVIHGSSDYEPQHYAKNIQSIFMKPCRIWITVMGRTNYILGLILLEKAGLEQFWISATAYFSRIFAGGACVWHAMHVETICIMRCRYYRPTYSECWWK